MTSPLDEPAAVRSGEELPLSSLEAYLRTQFPGAAGPLSVEQFPSGFSNLTYLLRLGSQEFVLRRPPFGNTVKSAHDMGREFRVLSRLCEVYEPAPRPLLFCEDASIIGDEFYLMERRHGVVLRGPQSPSEFLEDPDRARRLSSVFIANLARLHLLDYRAAGLGDLGRPEGYVERQVTGWSRRFEQARTDDTPEVDRLRDWLSAHQPADHEPSLIHNDYKYDNLLLDPVDLTGIVAVLDWEMATVGDPLMDLGATLAYWIEATDADSERRRAFGPTMAPGSLTRRELVDRYREQTGFEVPNVLFYYAFGLFKLAVIVQQIYARFVRGNTVDSRFAELNQIVQALGRRGIEALNAGSI